MHMTGPFSEPEAQHLDSSIGEVIDAVRNATRLLRSLAPLRSHWQALDMALAEFAQAAAFAPPVGPVSPAATGAAPQVTSAEPHLHAWMPPAPPGFVPAEVEPSNQDESVAAPSERRQLTIVVTRQDAPLDLVRAHGALEHVAGVESLVLASYTRGRAVLHAEVSRSPEQLALVEALRAAFNDPVSIVEESDDTLTLSIGERAAAF
jgi:hypothetical protein